MFREVTRVQQCLFNEGSTGWGLWDVKGGFQNVREHEVLERMDQSEHGKGWKGWVKNIFRKREFSMEWDGVIKGRGRTNVGVPQGSPLSQWGISPGSWIQLYTGMVRKVALWAAELG